MKSGPEVSDTRKLNYDEYRDLFKQNLSEKDFFRLSNLIEKEAGIKMPPQKKVMLEARLRKRMRTLGIKLFGEYCNFLFTQEGMENELIPMLDAVTTNKTDFFREPAHFDYLVKHALPDLEARGAGIRRKLLVWSAGCSTGEEPYTLAMVLSRYAEKHGDLKFELIATDISTRVLDIAKKAIYRHDRVLSVPMELRKKYLLKSKDSELVRIAPEIRGLITFLRQNFKEEDLGIREKIDVIFFRNVIIYFDRPTQKMILERICTHLRPDGYLFTGHAETLHNMDLPLRLVASSVYRKIK